jgi:myo-inositol-1-phosphate synthase
MDAAVHHSGKVRVGIVGVGNCASSFVQGLTYYADANGNEPVPGLMNVNLGGYRIGDIEISAALDVNARKVGRDVAAAITAPPNNTCRFSDVKELGVIVERGPTLDGIGSFLREDVEESTADPVDVTELLAEWRRRFQRAGIPIIGDDIKSQVGATIVHRVLANLFRERGVRLDRTYQLNFGGNSDFKNMLERERLLSKKISKTQSVVSQLDVPLAPDCIHVGPSDHVSWLTDRKWAYVRMEGTTFGGVPLNVELKLEVWDSPNSAGVVIDAVRCARLAMDRGIGGALTGPSSYFMKSPPEQFTDSEAHERTVEFIAGNAKERRRRST